MNVHGFIKPIFSLNPALETLKNFRSILKYHGQNIESKDPKNYLGNDVLK